MEWRNCWALMIWYSRLPCPSCIPSCSMCGNKSQVSEQTSQPFGFMFSSISIFWWMPKLLFIRCLHKWVLRTSSVCPSSTWSYHQQWLNHSDMKASCMWMYSSLAFTTSYLYPGNLMKWWYGDQCWHFRKASNTSKVEDNNEYSIW